MFERYPAWNHETEVATILFIDPGWRGEQRSSRSRALWERRLPGMALWASQRVGHLGTSGYRSEETFYDLRKVAGARRVVASSRGRVNPPPSRAGTQTGSVSFAGKAPGSLGSAGLPPPVPSAPHSPQMRRALRAASGLSWSLDPLDSGHSALPRE